MTPPSDPRRQRDTLIDAVLAESNDGWNAAVRARARAEFVAAQRRRHAVRILAQAAALAVLAFGLVWWTYDRVSLAPGQTVAALPSATAPSPTGGIRTISEEEMLAMFPPGSCMIAEIDNQRRLVFLNRDIEQNGADYPLTPAAEKFQN